MFPAAGSECRSASPSAKAFVGRRNDDGVLHRRTLRPLLSGRKSRSRRARLSLEVLEDRTLLATSPANGVEILIDDTGFHPDSVTIVAGHGVHWTNESIGPQSVTSNAGLFDSGTLQLQAGFSMALAIPGVHSYRSTSNPDFEGHIHVVLDALPGPSGEPANDNIPDITFPLNDVDEYSIHPDFGFRVSRSHILLGLVDDATVAQANAAIQAAKVVIIGGLPNSRILLVAAEDTPDFSGLATAIEALLEQPVIEFAAMSPEMELKVVPRAAESETANGGPNTWDWNLVLGPNDEPDRAGGNWGLESSRFPQAWNLLEEIRRRNQFESIITGVVDGGFGEHEDLAALTPTVVCKPESGGQKCTATTPDAHGVAVSGVIGATYDNDSSELGRSLGISGANPVAQMYGVNASSPEGATLPYENSIEVIDTLVSQFLDLRVINFSMGLQPPGFERDPVTKVVDSSGWWAAHGMLRTCGPDPGLKDDNTPAANQFCTPNNEDGWLSKIAELGKAARSAAENAAANGVIFVQAAGNEGDYVCIGDAQNSPGCTFERIAAQNISPYAWASSHWESTLANPIVIVEAIDNDREMPPFSNNGGDLSAPGVDITTTVPTGHNPDGYATVSGTSFAAPHVAGLIGYMLAFDPALSIEDITTRLIVWGRQDVAGGAQPRIDAYATMMSLPGAATAMVDVNDLSRDGNRRIVLQPGDTDPEGVDLASSDDIDPTTGTSYRTDPDGSIDMRDFRRWRDAWLQVCQSMELGVGDCLELDSVALNGDANHPKKDLNFDRCVNQGPGDALCPTPENTFARFDFNGDGRVSLYDKALVPLKPDGTPAAVPSEATMMTDLQVLMSQWNPDLDKTEGYTASDLIELVNSGDMEIHADDLLRDGPGEVQVEITRTYTNKILPIRTISAGDYIIYTLPAGVLLNIKFIGTLGGERIEESEPFEVTIPSAGFDARFTACFDRLDLDVFPRTLDANGSDQATIYAKLDACDNDSLDGVQIEFTQTPVGPRHGSLESDVVGVDAGGRATNVFTAGTEVAEYEITAVAALGNGKQVEGRVKISTELPLKIAYRWQQTILSFAEHGSSRWPAADPGNSAQIDVGCEKAYIVGMVFDQVTHQPRTGAAVEALGSGKITTTDASGSYVLEDIPLGASNAPVQITVRASAPGFNEDRVVTVFCGAIIRVEFGKVYPTSAIQGTVKDMTTDLPMPGVFIGSEFGEATITNGAGRYVLQNAPLNDDSADRTWKVTAIAPGFPHGAKRVTVKASEVSTLDFFLSVGDCDGRVIREHVIFPDIILLGVDTHFRENGTVTKFTVYQDGRPIAAYGYDLLPGVELPPDFQSIPGHVIGWDECIDNFGFTASPVPDSFSGDPPENLTLQREGILKTVGGRVLLDEFVIESAVTGLFGWSASSSYNPAGVSPVHNGTGTVDIRVPPNETERYQNYALPPTVAMEDRPEGLRVSGLNEIAELEYLYDTRWTFLSESLYGFTPPDLPVTSTFVGDVSYALNALQVGTHQAELMLVPRGDGSALRYAGDVSQPITFIQDEFGDYQKYEYCEVIESQHETAREYVSDDDASAGRLWKRNATFNPIGIDTDELDFFGSWFYEYPMPVGPGASKFRYSFVAIPYRDDAELESLVQSGYLEPPNCDETESLTANFSATPNPADEGSVVRFRDTSSSTGNSIVSWQWDFGDGESSDEQTPTHFYKDNGNYLVTLVVTDARGETANAALTIAVDNVAPEVQVDDASASEGEDLTLTVLLADQAEPDQAAIQLHLEISGVLSIDETHPAGIHYFTFAGLTEGVYAVHVTATDKDGGVSTDDAIIQVFGNGETPPPPPPPPPPTATCDPTVTLDAQEQAFLDLLNAYRIQSGVAPLEASPALTKATTRHALDMATNSFLGHIGSDGSTPVQRAIEEGYPSDDVDEVLASGLSQAVVVLFAWKASSPHNQILLHPLWNAVGIAREQGADWYWVADFGKSIDCPTDGFMSNDHAPAFAPASDSSLGTVAEHALVLPFGDGVDTNQAPSAVTVGTTRIVIPALESPPDPAQLTSPLLFPPIPAFVISTVNIAAGQSFTIRNASRDSGGQPIAAVFDPGDGTGPFNLATSASRQHSYAAGGTYRIGLAATDSTGASLEVDRPFEVTQPPTLPGDFNLTISPDTHVMAPGTTVNYLVSLAAINGFNSAVQLSTGALPSGVTAQFTPASVTPSGTSILQIAAASNAQTGQFQLSVSATGGGITHTTTSSVTVNFGLVPICYGAFEGTITDAETGLPLPDARIPLGSSTFADADSTGHYVIPRVNLNPNNAPRTYTFDANNADYWTGRKSAVAQCGIVTTLNFELVKIQYAAMSGFVTIGIPDPNNHSATRTVTSSGVPIAGARVGLTSLDDWRTDSNGFFDSGPTILPATNNAPRTSGNVLVSKQGYWSPTTTPVLVEPNKHIVANFTLVPFCYGSISGTVVFGDTRLPANLV